MVILILRDLAEHTLATSFPKLQWRPHFKSTLLVVKQNCKWHHKMQKPVATSFTAILARGETVIGLLIGILGLMDQV